jgi:hypothetical protein
MVDLSVMLHAEGRQRAAASMAAAAGKIEEELRRASAADSKAKSKRR